MTNKPLQSETKGIDLIAAERARHIEQLGYDGDHDGSHHVMGELADMAASYAVTEPEEGDFPFDAEWDTRPRGGGEAKLLQAHEQPDATRIRQLTKAGALIAAEIDRISGSPHSLKELSGE